jgi:hypothetical protein
MLIANTRESFQKTHHPTLAPTNHEEHGRSRGAEFMSRKNLSLWKNIDNRGSVSVDALQKSSAFTVKTRQKHREYFSPCSGGFADRHKLRGDIADRHIS